MKTIEKLEKARNVDKCLKDQGIILMDKRKVKLLNGDIF